METIHQVHAASYGTYGHRRVHAELVLGHGVRVSHGRVERLMRHTGLQGVQRRRLSGLHPPRPVRDPVGSGAALSDTPQWRESGPRSQIAGHPGGVWRKRRARSRSGG